MDDTLKRKIQAAQWLIESIEQRRNTLIKVTRAIVQHQRAFLDKGPEHIEPLKMQGVEQMQQMQQEILQPVRLQLQLMIPRFLLWFVQARKQ